MKSTPSKWRLLRTQPAEGAWNMAVDEAIMEFAAQGTVPPTLRLFAWAQPCLSLGYAQKISDVDISRLNHLGWGIVRRPTGGKAILHTDELTYSICGKNTDPHLSGSILESYQHLSQALLEALNQLGIIADMPKLSLNQDREIKQNPVCFEVPSNYEITVNDKKIIGSAQARKKFGVLQHGSLPLHGDITRIIDVLHYPDESYKQQARTALREHATTIEGVLGYPGDWWLTSYAIEDAFKKVLNINLLPMELSRDEGQLAFDLYNTKYNNSNWTGRI